MGAGCSKYKKRKVLQIWHIWVCLWIFKSLFPLLNPSLVCEIFVQKVRSSQCTDWERATRTCCLMMAYEFEQRNNKVTGSRKWNLTMCMSEDNICHHYCIIGNIIIVFWLEHVMEITYHKKQIQLWHLQKLVSHDLISSNLTERLLDLDSWFLDSGDYIWSANPWTGPLEPCGTTVGWRTLVEVELLVPCLLTLFSEWWEGMSSEI